MPRRPDIVALDWDDQNIELAPGQGLKSEHRFKPIESDEEWDEQGWATEPEPLTAAPRLGMRISIRLDPDESDLVKRAAKLSDVNWVEFVRRAALAVASEVNDRDHDQTG